MGSTRQHKRSKFSDSDRITLLEDDADSLELSMDGIQQQLRRLTQAILGALVMLSTSAVLLALNLAMA